MPTNPSHRLRPVAITSDQEALLAIQNIPTYRAINAEHDVAALTALAAAVTQAQQAETLAQQALVTARDAASAAEWALHEAILGAKNQVLAQFGRDSNEAQAVGLKKHSKRRRPQAARAEG